MRKSFIVFVFVLFSLSACEKFSSAQKPKRPEVDESISVKYKNYGWGMTMEEAKQQIKNNGYEEQRALNPERILLYADKFMDEDISVYLEFTPISQQLFTVSVAFEEGFSNIGTLKHILLEKYGYPWEDLAFGSTWKQNGEYVLSLDGDIKSVNPSYRNQTPRTMLSYKSPEHDFICKSEYERLRKQEIERISSKNQF